MTMADDTKIPGHERDVEDHTQQDAANEGVDGQDNNSSRHGGKTPASGGHSGAGRSGTEGLGSEKHSDGLGSEKAGTNS
jgi:hypothetical protein